MTVAAALAGTCVVLGVLCTASALMTVREMHRGPGVHVVRRLGWAWVPVGLAGGAHLLDRALQVLVGDGGVGTLELVAVVAGVPAAGLWFLLRAEGARGGRGDRVVTGEPGWFRAVAAVVVVGLAGIVAALVATALASFQLSPAAPPSLLLVALHGAIGWHLVREQLVDHAATARLSASGLALAGWFPAAAVMHGAWAATVLSGQATVGTAGFVFDWLGVAAAFSFLWAVRAGVPGTTWNQVAPVGT